MKNFLLSLSIVVGLVIAGVNAMDKEWLMDYQAQTGNQARFATMVCVSRCERLR